MGTCFFALPFKNWYELLEVEVEDFLKEEYVVESEETKWRRTTAIDLQVKNLH